MDMRSMATSKAKARYNARLMKGLNFAYLPKKATNHLEEN